MYVAWKRTNFRVGAPGRTSARTSHAHVDFPFTSFHFLSCFLLTALRSTTRYPSSCDTRRDTHSNYIFSYSLHRSPSTFLSLTPLVGSCTPTTTPNWHSHTPSLSTSFQVLLRHLHPLYSIPIIGIPEVTLLQWQTKVLHMPWPLKRWLTISKFYISTYTEIAYLGAYTS